MPARVPNCPQGGAGAAGGERAGAGGGAPRARSLQAVPGGVRAQVRDAPRCLWAAAVLHEWFGRVVADPPVFSNLLPAPHGGLHGAFSLLTARTVVAGMPSTTLSLQAAHAAHPCRGAFMEKYAHSMLVAGFPITTMPLPTAPPCRGAFMQKYAHIMHACYWIPYYNGATALCSFLQGGVHGEVRPQRGAAGGAHGRLP